jgi:hypothetical protein
MAMNLLRVNDTVINLDQVDCVVITRRGGDVAQSQVKMFTVVEGPNPYYLFEGQVAERVMDFMSSLCLAHITDDKTTKPGGQQT